MLGSALISNVYLSVRSMMKIHQRTPEEMVDLRERIIKWRLYGLTWRDIDERLGIRNSICYLSKKERHELRRDMIEAKVG